ncbi:putative zinc-type alcohol dehydrogenase-like protein YogA [Choanephora cucurbitarum]|uniref:Putative zinc-type alcohol dehydrogenase-like protein YogA n=1 Tax=Choanephora cucurbitarum TaxID=101091 RepID=A0A1C7NHZ2_9FUNG|nr:putative zinc-type alcohol dehydrogenase-like protein YogA [Choanephora cucurbitarum]
MVSVILSENPTTQTKYKYGFELKENKGTEVQSNQSVVKIKAAALNHRDFWILKGQYPGIKTGSVIGADGVAYVTKTDASNLRVGQRVLLNPGHGWDSDARGPERSFSILGLLPLIGTLTEEPVSINTEDLVACPDHLSNAEAAALPLAGLTAYRALFTKGLVQKGEHVLITGIGGGVALFALQFAVAAGAHVYVTSSSDEKIQKAIELGAKGGVNYKKEKPIDELKKLLGGNLLSAVIDGSGSSLCTAYPKIMRTGGILVCYGQTANTEGFPFTMGHVLKNIDARGSTMGSRREFKEMVEFVSQHKIKPVVSHVWHGLNAKSVDEAFATISNGEQFGKLVIEFESATGSPKL